MRVVLKVIIWGAVAFAVVVAGYYLAVGPVQRFDVDNPMELDASEVRSFENDTFKVDYYQRFGSPSLSRHSGEVFWIAYFEQANISMVVNKDTDSVIYANFGRRSAVDFYRRVLD